MCTASPTRTVTAGETFAALLSILTIWMPLAPPPCGSRPSRRQHRTTTTMFWTTAPSTRIWVRRPTLKNSSTRHASTISTFIWTTCSTTPDGGNGSTAHYRPKTAPTEASTCFPITGRPTWRPERWTILPVLPIRGWAPGTAPLQATWATKGACTSSLTGKPRP